MVKSDGLFDILIKVDTGLPTVVRSLTREPDQPVAQDIPPAAVLVPLHAASTTGLTHVKLLLQYSVPDAAIFPSSAHLPPDGWALVTHEPVAEQVKPSAVPVPVHAVPTAGVIHTLGGESVAPLQYSDPDTLPFIVHNPP